MMTREFHFDAQDRIYALLRVASLFAGLGYSFLSLPQGAVRTAMLLAFAVFVGYSAFLYLVGWRLFYSRAKGAFYVTAGACDLAFVAVLMHLTGDASSPFYRALYLWVATLAFYFGLRGGRIASLLALLVFVGFHLAEGAMGDPWLMAVQAGGMLMHGPLIGYLVDRERKRTEVLREAHGELAQANRRLVEEQAKLIQAEKLSSIGLLASGVAHEINNPLSGVMGCLKAMREGIVPEARREEYFETVRDGLERIRLTVEGLLDYARQRPPARGDLDVGEIISSCVRLLAPVTRKKDLNVDVRLDADHARVRADRSQLMQAFVNVLMNAAYAP